MISDDDICLAEDYADNAETQALVDMVDDPNELARLNEHRSENRSQESLNLILKLAIGMREAECLQ